MALELSAVAFRVDTTELDRAGKAIGELVTNVGKLDKAARTAAQTEAILARAAKDSAKANLDNAKAQDTRLKSTITADKADQQAEKAVVRKTKALEKANETTSASVSIIQRQKDILDFQTQGFSKGQSSILAYGKAAGLAADDISELGKVLETQRKLMGGDPFDKSLSGLKSLQNQYTELKESVRQYNTDSNLTAKQTRELARDKERLIEKMKVEGASFSEIRKAVRAHNDEYVNLAASYNKMTSAEDAVIKSRKDAVNATNYLTQADQKMAAALNTSNAALDKAGTDSLVKYETALRKSGVSQEVAATKLAKYKMQLEQVQKLEMARSEQFLARAIMPQVTDVAVSLWSGQNPLTVLLQQGGQVTDLFNQSGIAADKFGETVKTAMKGMLPSILTVVKGVGGLIVDGFMAAGTAVLDFTGKVTGMSAVMAFTSKKLNEMGYGGAVEGLQALNGVMKVVASVGIAAVITGLVSLAVAFKNAIAEGAELSRNLELTGASLALTKSAALDLAQSLASSERPVANVVSVITELAKAGKLSSDNIALVTNAAIDLERYGKVSIAETAKELTKLRDDPVKALIEVAEKTGYVDAQTIETVKSLREQGRMADAATVAMTAWADSSTRAATGIKNQMSPLEQVWDSMLSKINKVIGRLQDLARGSGLAEQIADKEAQLASVKGGFFTSTFGLSPKGAKDVNRLTEEIYLLKLQLQAETDITNERKRRSSAAAQMKAEEDAVKGYTDALDKQAKKELSLSEFVKKAVENRTKAIAAALGKNVEDVKVTAETIAKISKGAEAEWKAAQNKPKKDPSDNYYATLMREATAASVKADDATKSLTKSQVQLLEAVNDPRFLGLSKAQQENYLNTMAANVAKEQQIALTEEQGKAEDRLLRILGKSQGIGRQYYADMENMLQDAALLGKSREEIEELTRALFKATPAWKAYEKALEEVNSAARKFNEDSLASQSSTVKENQSLDYRLSLLGKTTEEQKVLSIEYNRANKLREVDIKLAKQLREIEEKIAKAKKDGLPESDYQSLIDAQVQARKDAAEQEKVINREVAVQYAEDFQKEFDAIKNGISDSIVTALFEGGKAGSKKFRDIVVAQLRKPVTMVVNAVVNTLLGNIAASATTGAAGDALSSAGGSILGSAIGGVSALGIGASYGASSLFANGLSATLSAGSSMIGAGSVMSGIGTIAGALGPIALGLSAVMTLAKKFDTSGTPHIGAGAIYSSAGGLKEGQGIYGAANFGMGLASEYTKGTQEGVSTIAKTLGQTFDGIAKSFGQTAGYEISTAFADDSSKDGSWGSLIIKRMNDTLVNWQDTQTSRWAPKEFANAEEGYKQYIAQIAKDARQVILDMNLAGWANDILMAIGDSPSVESLAAAVQQIAKVQSVFESFGQYMSVFANMADSAKTTLINASGGIDALTSNMSTFVDKFYTDAEKLAINSNNLSEELSKLGFEMPKTREEFKALVQSQIELGDSGAVSVAALLSLSGAMDAVLPAFTAVEDAVNSLSDVMKNLLGERKKLEAELLRAKGDQEGYAAALRAIATEGYTAAEIAAYDYNQALKSQVDALDAASKAAQDAAKAAQDAALNNVDNAFAALQKAVDAQKTIVQTSIDRLKSIFSILQTNIKELYNEVNSTFSMQASSGRSFIDEALAAAQSTGALPDPEKLSEALSAVRKGVDNNTYTSQFEADKDRLVLAGKLSVLSGISEDQLSNAELQLRSLNDILANAKLQVDAIKGVDNSVMSVEQAIANLANALSIAKGLGAGAGGIISDIPGSNSVYTGSALVKVPAEQYKGYTKDQISGRNNWTFGSTDYIRSAWQGGDYAAAQDIVNRAGLSQAGIQNSFGLTNEELAYVNSLGIQGVDPTKAVAGFDIMLGGGVSTNTGQSALFDTLAQQAQDALAAGNEMSIYQGAVDRGLNSADINSLLGLPAGAAENWAKENGLPVLRTGTNVVPQDGLAFLHKDEAVIPKAFNPWSGGTSMTPDDTAVEIRALREENKAQALAMVQLQSRLTKIIERWDGNGMPETRVV